MTVQATAGLAAMLTAGFTPAGLLADADEVQLDITYGAPYQATGDYAGPFTWAGATAPAPAQVWRAGTGQYGFSWQVPAGAAAGVYVATWTFTLEGAEYEGTENIWVAGGTLPLVPAGDTGYWTGGLTGPVTGAGIEFGQVDSTGTAWLWQSISGWDSPPVQGAGVIPRAGDHGAWASPQWFAARTLTLNCTASAQSQALRDVARATLQAAVPVGDAGQLTVLRYDEPVPKQALVRRSGSVTEKYPTLADVTFQVGLVAPDPRKYGTTRKTLVINPVPSGGGGSFTVPFTVPFSLAASPPPASAAAVNAGNFGSPPLAVITGPVTGPTLANLTTGQTVSWSQISLAAGQAMTVDFLDRQAWISAPNTPGLPGQSLGGGSYAPADISSAWWVLQPGSNAVQVGGGAGAGAACQLYFYDAWI